MLTASFRAFPSISDFPMEIQSKVMDDKLDEHHHLLDHDYWYLYHHSTSSKRNYSSNKRFKSLLE